MTTKPTDEPPPPTAAATPAPHVLYVRFQADAPLAEDVYQGLPRCSAR